MLLTSLELVELYEQPEGNEPKALMYKMYTMVTSTGWTAAPAAEFYSCNLPKLPYGGVTSHCR